MAGDLRGEPHRPAGRHGGPRRRHPDSTAWLAIRIRDNRMHVVLTSRMSPVSAIEARLLRAWTNAQ
jgi:hypothetical protein